jgi:hypothetical protein
MDLSATQPPLDDPGETSAPGALRGIFAAVANALPRRGAASR